ncbi:MAG: hypothetical protein LBU58_01460, partial [Clostridiales bacterium]|nr:hypothetical protein [Clostridiales bacterium]
WSCELYDTQSGDIFPIEAAVDATDAADSAESADASNIWTTVTRPLYEHDSLLLKLTPKAADVSVPAVSAAVGATDGLLVTARPGWPTPADARSGPAAGAAPRQHFYNAVPVTLEEPNVLLLDLAEYALDGEALLPREEILRLDNALRKRLGWPTRAEAVAQPWVEKDTETRHTVTLRYTFESEIAVRGAKLALERSELAEIRLNGADVPAKSGRTASDGWFVDRCIHTVPLPELAVGKNTLEVRYRYGRKVDLEALYLLGDFGVRVSGCDAALTRPVRELHFGDITRQGLPFYGGNIVYHLSAATNGDSLTIDAPYYRGQLLGVSVDGRERGHIIYSPYRLTVDGIASDAAAPDAAALATGLAADGTAAADIGRIHKVDLRFFGNRINTFGQLHCNVRTPGFWWGPNSWRTSGQEWSYEYRFWEQGILKSPEIT